MFHCIVGILALLNFGLDAVLKLITGAGRCTEVAFKQPRTASGFESRLKAKMQEGNKDNNTMISSPSMEMVREQPPTASGRFESRLKAKMQEGNIDNPNPNAARVVMQILQNIITFAFS